MKFLCVIVFMSGTFYCKSQEVESFTTIFSSAGKVFIGRSDKLNEAVELNNFTNNVTSLAVHQDYLYVSVLGDGDMFGINGINGKASAIWRTKLSDATSSGVDNKAWKILVSLMYSQNNISSTVSVKDYFFIGSDNGMIWQCLNQTNDCRNFYEVSNNKVVGIDYNPGDDKIYVALRSGDVRRCSPDRPHPKCDIILIKDKEILSMKIGFDALWLVAVKKNKSDVGTWLMKCPLSEVSTELDDDNDCQFEKISENIEPTGSVVATSTQLYLNFLSGDKIYSCHNPSSELSCKNPFVSMPDGQKVDRFIIFQ